MRGIGGQEILFMLLGGVLIGGASVGLMPREAAPSQPPAVVHAPPGSSAPPGADSAVSRERLIQPEAPIVRPIAEAPAARSDRDAEDGRRATFGFCHTGGGHDRDCVVDGDTIWLAGEKIRIADIDAPETHPPRCAEEARLGEAATKRLHDLLNAGPFALEIADRDTDRYGRKLRIVTRGGQSLGAMLVDEGLARAWGGRREPWC